MYKKSSSENQEKGFGENCLNQVWYDLIEQRKKVKTCEIALTSFALARSLLAGQKNKNEYDKQEELLFKKSLFTSANFICPRCYSLLKYCKIHGVNKVRNIAFCSRVQRMERKHRSR